MHRSWLQCTTLLHRCHTRMHQEALEILPQSYTSTALPVPTTPLPLTSHRRRMSCHGATFCKSGEISFTQMNMILWRWDIVYVFPFVLLSYVLWCWLCWWRRFSLLVARNRISVMKAASCARPISTGLQCRRWFNRLTMFNPLNPCWTSMFRTSYNNDCRCHDSRRRHGDTSCCCPSWAPWTGCAVSSVSGEGQRTHALSWIRLEKDHCSIRWWSCHDSNTVTELFRLYVPSKGFRR